MWSNPGYLLKSFLLYPIFITFNKISSILSWKAIKYDFGTFNISVFEKLEEPCSFRVTNVPFWIFCHLWHLRSIVLIIVDSEKPWISKHSVEQKIPVKVTWVKKHRALTRRDSYSNTGISWFTLLMWRHIKTRSKVLRSLSLYWLKVCRPIEIFKKKKLVTKIGRKNY